MNNLIIFGASTTAKAVYEFIKFHKLYKVLGFVVDKEYKTKDNFCDLPLYDFENLPKEFCKKKDYLFIAVQWNRLNKDRRNHFQRFKRQQFKLANIISPNAIIYRKLNCENCWICDGVILEKGVVLGHNVFVKSKSVIQHDSIVEDHCFIGANCTLMGNVKVSEQSYIGASSSIFNRVAIGKKCLVGAGVIVKRNMANYSIIKTRNDSYITIQSTENEIENKLLANKNIR